LSFWEEDPGVITECINHWSHKTLLKDRVEREVLGARYESRYSIG
jgi:hypothetical protein